MTRKSSEDISRRFDRGNSIERAINQGIRAAIETHRRNGVPMAIFKDGRIVEIAPEVLPGTKSAIRRPSAKAKSKGTSKTKTAAKTTKRARRA